MRVPRGRCVAACLVCVLALSAAAQAQQRGGASLSPRQILQKMAQAYASCSSYQDEGAVEVAFHEETGGRIERIPFKTFFRRPGLFRFEWIDYGFGGTARRRVVWSDGKETFTYWEPDRFEKDESLEMGIAGATGVSSGSASTISSLLLRDSAGFSLTDLVSLSLAGVEEFEGVECYRIRGKHPDGDPYEVWIGAKDFLVRKVIDRHQFDTFYTIHEEVRRNIRVGAPLAESAFNFKPPIPLSAREDKREDAAPLVMDESPNWAEFYSPEGRFKVLLPTKPMTQTLTLETARGSLVHHGFTAARLDAVCVIDYADVATGPVSSADMKQLFDAARDEFVRETQGRVTSETPITLDGNPGREIRVAAFGGESRLRLYLVGGRFYSLAFMKPMPGDKPAAEADKFFDSFKLVAEPKKVAALRSGDR